MHADPSERDMDICRPKDHKRWSRPSFCGLSGYEPKIWHPGLLGRASCTIRAVPGSNPGHFTTKSCLFSSVRTPVTPKTKILSFLLGSNPGHYTTTKTSFQAASLYSSTIFFLSLPRPSLEKKDSRCKGGERDMDICRQKGPQTMVETILLWSVSSSPAPRQSCPPRCDRSSCSWWDCRSGRTCIASRCRPAACP